MRGSLRFLAVSVLALGVAAVAVRPTTAAASPLHFHALRPGQRVTVPVDVKVNVVLVGYPRVSVDVGRMLRQLPATGTPIVRDPAFYDIHEPVGVQYRYRYRAQFASNRFDDRLFAYLRSIGTIGSPDSSQVAYNHQVHRSLTVGPRVLYIDAPSTERWLETHSALLGIKPNDYTVFLIDWYGRPDFQFHVYTKIGTADPDTGYDAGLNDLSHVNAWGGSSGPTWFYDMSAGPVYWDDSWNVDDADLYGDGLDYRIPPVWEYGNTSAYRPFTDPSGDLGRVLRYVAVDLLFTPSPLYDPAATVPQPGGSKQIVMDIFEGDPSSNGLHDIRPALVQHAHQYLEPYYPISITVHDQPLAGGLLRAFHIANGTLTESDCWNAFGDQLAELYCYLTANRSHYFPPSGRNAVIPAVGFTVPDSGLGDLRFTGLTDDDWSTGAPSFIYTVDAPIDRTPAYNEAYTHLLMHEAGHYVGLSHPHDGYDPGTGVDYVAGGTTDFAWLGDESATTMSYLEPYETFDVLNRDNLARWQVGRLLNLADTDAAAILARSDNPSADTDLVRADAEFVASEQLMAAGQWVRAATEAVHGYQDVQRADSAAGIGDATASAAVKAAMLTTHALRNLDPCVAINRRAAPVTRDSGLPTRKLVGC